MHILRKKILLELTKVIQDSGVSNQLTLHQTRISDLTLSRNEANNLVTRILLQGGLLRDRIDKTCINLMWKESKISCRMPKDKITLIQILSVSRSIMWELRLITNLYLGIRIVSDEAKFFNARCTNFFILPVNHKKEMNASAM